MPREPLFTGMLGRAWRRESSLRLTGGVQLDGQSVATAQLGGSVQAPQVAGVNFNRPGNAFGVQPTVLNQPAPQLNLFNLFGQQGRAPAQPQRPVQPQGPALFQPFQG